MNHRSFLVALAVPALVAAAAGCREEPEPAPAATATAAPEPEATAEAPTASIIRPDIAPEPVAPPPPPPLEAMIGFPEGGHALDAKAEAALRETLESDQLAEGWPIVLRGHSDSSGSDEANLRVSRARAEAVADWLIEQGVDEERISVIAFGEQNPVAPNARPDGTPDEAGRARNRRVEIAIAPSSEASDSEMEDGDADGASPDTA